MTDLRTPFACTTALDLDGRCSVAAGCIFTANQVERATSVAVDRLWRILASVRPIDYVILSPDAYYDPYYRRSISAAQG